MVWERLKFVFLLIHAPCTMHHPSVSAALLLREMTLPPTTFRIKLSGAYTRVTWTVG